MDEAFISFVTITQACHVVILITYFNLLQLNTFYRLKNIQNYYNLENILFSRYVWRVVYFSEGPLSNGLKGSSVMQYFRYSVIKIFYFKIFCTKNEHIKKLRITQINT